MILSATTHSLNVLLGAAGAHPFVGGYAAGSQVASHVMVGVHGVTNGTTPVVVIPAPGSGVWHKLLTFMLQSVGGVSTVTLRFSDGATNRDFTFALVAEDKLIYEQHRGFYVLDAAGEIRTV